MANSKKISVNIDVDTSEVDKAKEEIEDLKKSSKTIPSEIVVNTDQVDDAKDDIKDLEDEAKKPKPLNINIPKDSKENMASLRSQIKDVRLEIERLSQEGDLKGLEEARGQLADLEDAFDKAKSQSLEFHDALAEMPGPAGMAGKAIQAIDGAFKAFAINPVVVTITAIVGLFLALRESLTKTTEGQEKLNKISSAFSKIMNGLLAVLEPVANFFADLIIKITESETVMNILSTTTGVIVATFKSLYNVGEAIVKWIGNNFVIAFTSAIKVAKAFGDVIKGVFTFDWELIKKGVADGLSTVKEGFTQIGDNLMNTGKAIGDGVVNGIKEGFDQGSKAFEEGAKRLTEQEKELTKTRLEQRLADIDNRVNEELAEAKRKYASIKELFEIEQRGRRDRLSALQEYYGKIKGVDKEEAKSTLAQIKALQSEIKQSESTFRLEQDQQNREINQKQWENYVATLSERQKAEEEIERNFIQKKRELQLLGIKDFKDIERQKWLDLFKLRQEYTQREADIIVTNVDNTYNKEKFLLDKQLAQRKLTQQQYNKQLEQLELDRLGKLAVIVREGYVKTKKELEESYANGLISKSAFDEQMLLLEQNYITKRVDIVKQGNDLVLTEIDNNNQAIEDRFNFIIKGYDDKLTYLQLKAEALSIYSKDYFDNQREQIGVELEKDIALLNKSREDEMLANIGNYEVQAQIAQKYDDLITARKEANAKRRKEIGKEELAAYGQLASAALGAITSVIDAVASKYDEEAKTSKEAFEKRKKLQVASAYMSAASGIINILTQPSVIPSPGDWILKGVNAVALGIATASNIKKIKATTFEGGGDSGSTTVPAFSQPSIPVPNVGQSQSQTGTLANIVNSAIQRDNSKERPIKAYVTQNDIRTEEQLNRRIRTSARLG